MNLYIHVGIHKTGSSYLQTLFARNRDLLAEHSIYYSKSERDKEMLKGRISPGNALKLNKLLRDSKYEEVKKYLQRLVLQAEKINCKSVLLSNEGLFHIFAKEGTVLNFIEICKASGFKNIHGLVYFRDPVDHILSLYKHRAKSGKHSDFRVWLYEEYETFSLMESFLDYKDISGINWSCRLYKKDSHFMAHSSFKDWLKIRVPNLEKNERVNQSLTLSEIVVKQEFASCFPNLNTYLQKSLSSISMKHKADDSSFENYYLNMSLDFQNSHKDLFNKVSELMPEKEKMDLILSLKNNYSTNPILSRKQIRTISDALWEYNSWDTQIKMILKKFIQILRNVKK